jgi:predicted nucleotidyltransferase
VSTQKIQKYLRQIEEEKQVKILLACETGSRAWGFPSPDSDFDVRLIYAHPKDWYLNLQDQKDSIEIMQEENELDFSGWDLRKTLRLLWKSNPPLLERIQSPIIYQAEEGFKKEILELTQTCYSRIATLHHYLSMAKKTFSEVNGKQEYKLKKLFYALRTATASRWILEKSEMPPIEFQQLLAGLGLESSLLNQIRQLISLKATASESYLHTGEKAISDFIRNCIENAEKNGKDLPASVAKMEDLNSFFKKWLG